MRLLLACLTALSAVGAQEQRWPLHTAELTLPPGEAKEWLLPAARAGEGERLVLEWSARMESPRLGGSMYFLEVELNGRAVSPALDRVRCRLLNKPPMTGRADRPMPWHAAASGWRIVYAPDFEAAKASEYGPEAYRFVVDVTDLMEPEGTNRLTIRRRTALNQSAAVLRGVELRREAGTPVVRTPVPGLLPTADSWRLGSSDDGAPVVAAAGASFPLTTRISRPGGGWYRIGPASLPGEPAEWDGAAGGRYAGNGFTVARKLTQGPRVVVEDTFENVSGADLGWMVRYEWRLPGPAPTVYLGGDDDPAVESLYRPANPTVYVPLGGVRLGLVIEDDVLRAQARVGYQADPAAVYAETQRLALPPGGRCTLRLALYPRTAGDYFEFINQVRSDWGVRATVDGPILWGFYPHQVLALSDQDIAQGVQRQGIRQFVSGGGWNDPTIDRSEKTRQIGFGTGVLEPFFAPMRERMKRAADKIRAAAPGVKVLYYNHCFFNVPESDPERFRDSWIVTAAGQRFVNGWSGAYTASGGVYPTLTNTFGPAWRRTLDTLLDQYGADGVYWDDSSWPTGLGEPITYGEWDQRSAILDPATFAIQARIGNLLLLAKAYRLSIHEHLARRGAPLLCNGQPTTLDENRLTSPRFSETHDSLGRSMETHLYTPLAYARPNPSIADIRARLALGVLWYRVGLTGQTDAPRHFYPITITDLHAGWVRGEERVVTMTSGSYGWPGAKGSARLYRYSADGAKIEETVLPPAETFAVSVPEGGLAILERVAGPA